MKKVLVLFAHPALEKSRVNRRLVEAIRDLEGVTFCDLYEQYPEFDIDVQRQQTLLQEHDVLVLQHPFFWYSSPALVKEWMDLVLQHGWAYGSEGKVLAGKWALSAVTTGGREDAYCAEGYNRFTMRQLLAPIEQTFRLCGMHYLPPFVAHGTLRMTADQIQRHARDFRRVLEALRDDRIDPDAIADRHRINWKLEELVPNEAGVD